MVWAGDTEAEGAERREMIVDARDIQPDKDSGETVKSDSYLQKLADRGASKLLEQLRTGSIEMTLDADGRITSAIGDMAEPALTVAADGGITAPEAVRTKLELGDGYGMRGASALGKEWYEHSAGYCSYLKGKTEAEAASIPADGSDPDLAALCTISIDALQKAVGDAFENAGL